MDLPPLRHSPTLGRFVPPNQLVGFAKATVSFHPADVVERFTSKFGQLKPGREMSERDEWLDSAPGGFGMISTLHRSKVVDAL